MPAATTMQGRAPAVALVVIACLLAALLAACGGGGGGNPESLPEFNAALIDPTAAATETESSGTAQASKPGNVPLATPSPQVKYTPADALGQGAWAERGRIKPSSSTKRAIATAVTKYLSVRVQLSNTWQVDEEALAATASGQAVTSARERAERQRQRDWRSIGRFVVNVSSVKVDGDHATVTGCHFDGTSEVDRDGNVMVAPPGGVLITMNVQRTGETWRVLDWPDRKVPSCDWRS